MKMIYLLKSKSKNSYPWKIIFIIVIFILLSLFGFLFPSFSRSTAFLLGRPLWFWSEGVVKPFNTVQDFFIFKNRLISRSLSLEDEVTALKLKVVDYDILLKENQDLKNKLGRGFSSARLFTKVLSKPPRSPYDTFVVDLGSNAGVQIGDKVYLSENVILGEIKSVTSATSIFELFSSGSGKVEAILSRTGASFILQGKGGANFELEIPKDTDVLWGDSFIYPGLSLSVIGSVYYIDTNSQSSFKTIYLRVPGNVFQVQSVFVEKTQ